MTARRPPSFRRYIFATDAPRIGGQSAEVLRQSRSGLLPAPVRVTTGMALVEVYMLETTELGGWYKRAWNPSEDDYESCDGDLSHTA